MILFARGVQPGFTHDANNIKNVTPMMQSLYPCRIVGIKWCGVVESLDSLGGDDEQMHHPESTAELWLATDPRCENRY